MLVPQARQWRSGRPTLLDGLVLGWPLNEPVTGSRRALRGNPAGVLTDVNTVGTADAPTGIGGLCATFDGSTEYLYCADPFPPPTALTLSAWVYPTSVGATTKSITMHGRGATSSISYGLYISTAAPGMQLSADGVAVTTAAASNVSANAWALITGVWDGATLTVFNGVTPGTPAAFTSALFNSTAVLAIGSNGSANFFPGRIAQPLIWRRALAPAEIAYLYADGTGRPLGDWMPPWWFA